MLSQRFRSCKPGFEINNVSKDDIGFLNSEIKNSVLRKSVYSLELVEYKKLYLESEFNSLELVEYRKLYLESEFKVLLKI